MPCSNRVHLVAISATITTLFMVVLLQLLQYHQQSSQIVPPPRQNTLAVMHPPIEQEEGLRRGTDKKKLIHRFWTAQSETLNRKVRTSLRSAVRTQNNAQVILWTLPASVELMKQQTKEIREMRCATGSTFEVRSTDELLRLVENSNEPRLQMCSNSFLAVQSTPTVAFSDLLRFIALYFFGGIYADADVIFLRDMGYFHGLPFAYKWDRDVQYYNTAIMGLPPKSQVVLKIIDHFKACDPNAFYPSKIHEAFDCSALVCQELLMMPTALFSPVSAPMSNWQWQRNDLNRIGYSTDWFFGDKRMWGLDHFFPGAYTFHWHNRWDHAIQIDSWFADLERLNDAVTTTEPLVCRRIFVDLGGYTGDTLALYGGERFMSRDDNVTTKEIYVFEIDFGKITSILERLDGPLIHLKPITQVLNVAAWNKDTVLRVALTGHNDGRVNEGGQTQMLAYDIGSWIQRAIAPQPCDDILLKIDIEGAEVEALQSLHKSSILPLIDHLIVEWHDYLMPAVAVAKPGLVEMLRKEGLEYKYATLDHHLDTHYLPGERWPVNHCDSHFFRNT